MVSPGIWVLWSHELPPLNATVETRWTDADVGIVRGTRCQRGCCFFPDGINDACVTPMWWRLPEQRSAE